MPGNLETMWNNFNQENGKSSRRSAKTLPNCHGKITFDF